MKDYIKLYIQLCGLISDNTADYGDKRKVKIHNSAMKKLNAICDELRANIPYATELLSTLLKNENEQVKLISASHCLKLGICSATAKNVLIDIQRNSNNKVRAFDAEMILKSLK
jgi:hypothetical protein